MPANVLSAASRSALRSKGSPALLAPLWQRLAGQRRQVQQGHAPGHRAIDRHHVAAPDQEAVAGTHIIQRDLFQPAIAVAHHLARHPRQQRRHLGPGATLGEGFQRLPAGIHQRDHGRRQHFAEQQRGDHRQRRDDIQPEVAPPQRGDDLDDQHRQHRDRGAHPDRVGRGRIAPDPEGQADDQPRQRHHDQDVAQRLLRLGQVHPGLSSRWPRSAHGSARQSSVRRNRVSASSAKPTTKAPSASRVDCTSANPAPFSMTPRTRRRKCVNGSASPSTCAQSGIPR